MQQAKDEEEFITLLHEVAMSDDPQEALLGRTGKLVVPMVANFMAAEDARGTELADHVLALLKISISTIVLQTLSNTDNVCHESLIRDLQDYAAHIVERTGHQYAEDAKLSED